MGLPRSLAMLFIQIWLFHLSDLRAQSITGSSLSRARTLDTLLQDYAFRAFNRPRTGIPYDGQVPSNLTGIKITAMRLRRGSLRSRGVPMYKEFVIPTGVIVQPYVKRLVLVYQNLGNWSRDYYPTIPGHTYLAPVLGLLAYNASNLSAIHIPELDIRASGDPILINFTNVRSGPGRSVPKCVWFNLQGVANFTNVESGNVCSTIRQGHFSIVVESIAPAPAPISLSPPGGPPTPPSKRKKKNNSNVWIIVGSTLGGILLLVALTLLVLWAIKYKKKRNMQHMERAAESGEALRMTSIGDIRAPAAIVTRTQPTIETEYVP